MRWSKSLIPTLKENPQEAVIKSHRLMMRSGLIRKLASGTYSYLPLGQRALQKATSIVREEMDSTGALEVLLPAIHPAEIWRETGRYAILGDDMIHFKDRHGKENVLGPTHEEVITDLARREIHSYKQLPLTLYQIQTKFRDEMRPRSGIIRSREFVMKDAYSFHVNDESLNETYEVMKEAYKRIFTRCGLDFFIVQADPGAMGGSGSQEFVLFSDAGEDRMVQLGDSDTVVSVEMATRRLKGLKLPSTGTQGEQKKVFTPGHSSVESVAQSLKKTPVDLVKTMIYERPDKSAFAVLVRGDHEVSEYKLKKQEPGAYLATRETIDKLGSALGFSGPFGLNDIMFYVDEDVVAMKDFVTGANERDHHLTNVNLMDIVASKKREMIVGDFRQVAEGDASEVDGKEVKLHFKTAIELGHVFKLNKRYSDPMKATVVDSAGKETTMIMGCYGIGVNRILAAAIEQSSDDKGIIWPKNISPYQVEVVVLDTKDTISADIVNTLTNSPELKAEGIDFLIDDREETAGVKFNDADLLGFPVRVVLGPRNLKLGKVELKQRKSGQVTLVDIPQLVPTLVQLLKSIS